MFDDSIERELCSHGHNYWVYIGGSHDVTQHPTSTKTTSTSLLPFSRSHTLSPPSPRSRSLSLQLKVTRSQGHICEGYSYNLPSRSLCLALKVTSAFKGALSTLHYTRLLPPKVRPVQGHSRPRSLRPRLLPPKIAPAQGHYAQGRRTVTSGGETETANLIY